MRDHDLFDRFATMLRACEPSTPDFLSAGEAQKTNAAIAVYRNNVRASLSTALAEKFPVIEQLVGEDFFKFTAREYFNTAPPTSPIIANYGNQLPKFLEQFEPAKKLPYLPDMARLEIAWLHAYRARDVDPLEPETILAAGDPAGLRLHFHPSFQLLTSAFPIASIWRRHQADKDPAGVLPKTGEYIIIARPQRTVLVEILPQSTHRAITDLIKGATVAQSFEAAAQHDPAFDPQAVFQALFRNGAIIGVDTPAENPTS